MIDALELAGIIREQIAKATAPLLMEIVTLKAQVAATREPRDGKDADPEFIRSEVTAQVARALAELPRPKDGVDGKDGAEGMAGKDGAPGQRGEVGETGPMGPPGESGRDGINGKDGQAGINGKDGTEGREGRDGMPGVPGREGEKGLDGLNGKDGVDGFVLDDVSLDVKDGNKMVWKLKSGEREKLIEIRLPTNVDRGVYKDGDYYEAGAGVTYGGSYWLAQVDTRGTPGKSADWRLAVRRGKDGKDSDHA